MRVAMSDILRLTNVVALDILRALLSGQEMTPKQISRAIDAEPQAVRNALVHLKTLKMVSNIHYGEYLITEYGKSHLEYLSQSSNDQSSRRSE